MSQQNSLCFPCLEKVRTKFPVFPVAWPPCSSRMCTAHLPTVHVLVAATRCQYQREWVYHRTHALDIPPLLVTSGGHHWRNTNPLYEQTDTCENMTFPQLCLREVKTGENSNIPNAWSIVGNPANMSSYLSLYVPMGTFNGVPMKVLLKVVAMELLNMVVVTELLFIDALACAILFSDGRLTGTGFARMWLDIAVPDMFTPLSPSRPPMCSTVPPPIPSPFSTPKLSCCALCTSRYSPPLSGLPAINGRN